MLSAKAKRNIARIIPFAIAWLAFSLVYALLERGLLGSLGYYPSTGNPYNFTKSIFITPACALVVGVLMGTVEVLYFYKLFVQQSFFKKIVYKTIIYLTVVMLFLFTLSLISNAVELKASIFSVTAWANARAFFYSYSFWSVAIYIGAIISVSLFYSEVSDNLGQRVLNNFFTGKYHSPKAEERIFMFADMKSSTTIAENIGHVQYFQMLKEYFSDLTDPIIQFSGDIYQYVGDEIVVTWTLHDGLTNNNCIQCFFAMKAAIERQEKKYKGRFGVVPSFKAGFHLGKVTTGEIGVIKKDIIFTGDVLNTTARIQSLCNKYQTDILISGPLIKQLQLDALFKIKALGENELRGRDKAIELFTLQPLQQP